MPRPISIIVTFLAAVMSGFIGVGLVLPFGLIAPQGLIFPATLAITALLSALGASWVSNLLTRRQSYSRLPFIIGIAEATAVVLALILGVVSLFGGRAGPLILPFGLSTIIIAVSVTAATWQSRDLSRNLKKDGLMTAGSIVLAGLVFVGAIFLASLFGLVGA